jgi:hypothetical protein
VIIHRLLYRGFRADLQPGSLAPSTSMRSIDGARASSERRRNNMPADDPDELESG